MRLCVVVLFALPTLAIAQYAGPSSILPGQEATYTYTLSSGGFISPIWTVSNGVKVSTTVSSNRLLATVVVKWSAAGSGYVKVTDGGSAYGQYNVTVGSCPSLGAPTFQTIATICGGFTQNITANPGTNGNNIKWYSSPYNNSPVVGEGTIYTTPLLWATTTFYAVTAITNSSCVGTKTPVTVNVNKAPAPPLDLSVEIAYGKGVITLKSEATMPGEAVRWYAALTGGSYLAQSDTYVTPELTESKDYYYTSINLTTNCETVPRARVTARVANYVTPASVKTEAVRVDAITKDSQLYLLTESQKSTAFTHFDGLMRPTQEIVLKATPTGKDVIHSLEYDAQGHVAKDYLPYTATTNSVSPGAFHNFYKTEQPGFYNNLSDNIADDTSPFSTSKFEQSPFDRLIQAGFDGADWQPGTNHGKKFSYSYNTGGATAAEEVRQFKSNGTSTGFYTANTLSRLEIIDENGKKEIIFRNSIGNVVVHKKQLDAVVDNANSTVLEYQQTYYIYDDFNRIKYIISPKGTAVLKSNGWSLTGILDSYVYQFVYDKRGRLIEKKVPGQAWMYYCYDRLNRLVLAQDGLLKAQNKWVFIKYDKKGRAIMHGLYSNSSSRATIQTTVIDLLYANSTDKYFEDREQTYNGYSNQSFPTSGITEIWLLTYFDSYDHNYNNTIDNVYVPQALAGELTPVTTYDRPTATKRRIPNTGTWLYTYAYYDKYGRIIQTQSNSHLDTTSYSISTFVYDHEGKLLTRKIDHNPGGSNRTTVHNSYTYDAQGRLVSVKQKNNSDVNFQELAKYNYNELGQLVDKKLHNTSGANYLQSVDYRYNIRGWLSSINSAQLTSGTINDDVNDYFGMELLYNKSEASGMGNAMYFDGKISGIKWKGPASSGESGQRSYKYAYDNSGQLTSATFQVREDNGWTAETNAQNENISYDLNGNIRKLQRNQRKHVLGSEGGVYVSEGIDDLTYSYDPAIGDRLLKVDDAISGTGGFVNGANIPTEYTYDANGNVLKDENKSINSNIIYNSLGKPTSIVFADGRKVEYEYDALGTKLAMKTWQGTTLQMTTDYVDGFVYEDKKLRFFGSSEGRVFEREGVNLIANSDATSTSGFTATANVIVSAVTIGGETYVKGESNASTSTPGIHPIGGTFSVQAGQRYVVRVKGYSIGSQCYIRAYTNLGDIKLSSSWKGAQIPVGATAESWANNQFIIPTGATTLQVSVLWSNPTLTDEMYVNKVELMRVTDEFQYAISDHLGNTRVVFTSAALALQQSVTNFETTSNPEFQNYPGSGGGVRSTLEEFDHTDAGSTYKYSQLLNAGYNSQIGVAKSYKVYPGDKVKIAAYAKYTSVTGGASNLTGFATALTSAFGVSSSSSGDALKAYDALSQYGTWVSGGTGHGSNPGDPKGFVTILTFDKNYNFLDAAWDQIDADYSQVLGQPKTNHDELIKEVTISEEGYVYVFVSNESSNFIDIYFDDVTMIYSPSNVIQYNEYYPFGLQAATSWTRANNSNNFKYNGASELNSTSGWYDLPFRNYDAALGRFMQVDPLSVSEMATYQYAGNNPVNFNDPWGLNKKDPDPTGLGKMIQRLASWMGIEGGNDSWWGWVNEAPSGGGSTDGPWSLVKENYRESYYTDKGTRQQKKHWRKRTVWRWKYDADWEGFDLGDEDVNRKEFPSIHFRLDVLDPAEPRKHIPIPVEFPNGRFDSDDVDFEEEVDFTLVSNGQLHVSSIRTEDFWASQNEKPDITFDKESMTIFGRVNNTSFTIAIREGGEFIVSIVNDDWAIMYPFRYTQFAVRIIGSSDLSFSGSRDAVIGAKQAGVDKVTQVTSPGWGLGPTGLEKLPTKKNK